MNIQEHLNAKANKLKKEIEDIVNKSKDTIIDYEHIYYGDATKKDIKILEEIKRDIQQTA